MSKVGPLRLDQRPDGEAPPRSAPPQTGPCCIGVTGTNGKTTTTWFLHQLLKAVGKKVATVSNRTVLGLEYQGVTLTTPMRRQFRDILNLCEAEGIDWLVAEVSSHGLQNKRVADLRFGAAAFTNLSPDHLDFHGDMQSYARAKALLFRKYLREDGVAVIGADDPFSGRMVRAARGRTDRIVTVGRAETAEYRLQRVEASGAAQIVLASFPQLDGIQRISLPFPGQIMAQNALVALAVLCGAGFDPVRLIEASGALTPPPGRMERVATLDNGAVVYVDYAHNGAGLVEALRSIRPHVGGRLHVVISAGGNRDLSRRQEIGPAAAAHADLVYVTDSVPRTEDPARIRASILANCPGAIEVADRRRAVAEALSRLEPGDALLLTERGDETEYWTPDGMAVETDAELVNRLIPSVGKALHVSDET